MNSATHGLTPENLLGTLPGVLRKDEGTAALAAAAAEVLSQRTEEIRSLMIYSQIDSLPEKLLDILAHDFKVDWWNPDYTVAEKRKTLKDSWHVHRTLGTKYAVVTAISAIYREAVVQEWWEYGGEPYTFRLNINAGDEQIDIEKYRQVLERITYYKNLRSALDAVIYVIGPLSFVNCPGKLLLQKLRLVFSFSNMPGGRVILFDGQRKFDGTWYLNQAFRGVELGTLALRFALEERGRAVMGGLSLGGMAARNRERAALPSVTAIAAVSNAGRAGYRRLAWSVGVKQKYGLSGSLTRDSMWRFDSAERFDGSRRFDAAIIKEEI